MVFFAILSFNMTFQFLQVFLQKLNITKVLNKTAGIKCSQQSEKKIWNLLKRTYKEFNN